MRKAKKAGPLTTTAINGLIREAGEGGKTLEEAVTICCERGVAVAESRVADGPPSPTNHTTHRKAIPTQRLCSP